MVMDQKVLIILVRVGVFISMMLILRLCATKRCNMLETCGRFSIRTHKLGG